MLYKDLKQNNIFSFLKGEMINQQVLFQLPSIEKFFKRFIWSVLVAEGTKFFIWVIAFFLSILLLASFTVGETFRQTLVALLATVSVSLSIIYALKMKKFFDYKLFCKFLEQKASSFQNLLNAYELAQSPPREGISGDLKGALIQLVESKLAGETPRHWIRIENLKEHCKFLVVLIGLTLVTIFVPPHLLISGWNRLVWGDQKELMYHLNIFPQGGEVISGESVEIIVELLRTDYPCPKLYVEGSQGLEEVVGQTIGRKSSFRLNTVIEPISYKVRWRDLESPFYKLSPIDPPRLTDFTVKIVYPSYMELPAQVFKGDPQIQTYRGSQIHIEARSTKELEQIEMVASLGLRFPVKLKEGEFISTEFAVQNPFQFWFDMKDSDGLTPLHPARYEVLIKEDKAPQVRLLAPVSDLIVGRESKIPFTFEFKDDVGVTALFLRIARGEHAPIDKVLLKKYQPSLTEKIDSLDFSLGSIKVASGELLNLQLEVQDNDTVTGPKSGFSETIQIEIQSYEKEHAKIEEELKEFKKNLIDLLADQTQARISDDEWKSASANPSELEKKTNESIERQSQIIAKTERIEKELRNTLSKMERDPLTDFTIWNEHKAFQDALESLRSGDMEQAKKKFTEKNYGEAGQHQDSAISELERLSTLSEEVYKYGKMKDLMHAADRLTEKGEEINKRLASTQEVDPSLLQLLQDTLKEAQQILSEIQQQVQDLPQELPDDFVNQPAVKDLNLNEMSNTAQKLNESLRQGDIQSALRAAQELVRQAKAARETISKAAEEVATSGLDDLSKKTEEKGSALQKLVDEQEKILAETNNFELKRQQSILENQKKLLDELTQRQQKVLQNSRSLSGRFQPLANPSAYEMIELLNMSVPKMEKVLKEFEQKNVMFSQKWLEEIIQHLEPSTKTVEKLKEVQHSISVSTPVSTIRLENIVRTLNLVNEVQQVKIEEESILRLLKSPPSKETQLNSEDVNRLNQLSKEQGRLAEESKKLRNEIAQLSSKSALVDHKISESLGNAHTEMKSAEKALGESETGSAQQREDKALSYLRQGQEGLQRIQQQLSQSKQQMSMQKGGGLTIQPRNLPGGSSGFRTGVVHIPRADEYLPPREFRGEIIEALKERYPKSHETIIKDYYKRLSQ